MATDQQPSQPAYIIVSNDRPLIGVTTPDSESDEITYFTDDDDADTAVTDEIVDTALSLAGAWGDLSWDEIEDGLSRIREANDPTPPLEL